MCGHLGCAGVPTDSFGEAEEKTVPIVLPHRTSPTLVELIGELGEDGTFEAFHERLSAECESIGATQVVVGSVLASRVAVETVVRFGNYVEGHNRVSNVLRLYRSARILNSAPPVDSEIVQMVDTLLRQVRTTGDVKVVLVTMKKFMYAVAGAGATVAVMCGTAALAERLAIPSD